MNPLQIYRKHPSAPDTYYIGGGWSPACITAVEKRLTDAELAAELHASENDWRSLMASRYDYSTELERCEILYRFATLPHYDENPA